MNISSIVKAAGKAVVKHLPDILIGLGIAVGVSGTVVAVKRSKKFEENMKEPRENLDIVRSTEYETKKERATALTKAYTDVAKAAVKTYGPVVGLEAASVGLILAGRGVGASRLAKSIASGTAAAISYKNYRDNVIKDLGEEADFRYQTGVEEVPVITPEYDKDGKEKIDKNGNLKTKKDIIKVKTGKSGMYVKAFGPMSSTEWVDDPNSVLALLSHVESWANTTFINRGMGYVKGPKVMFMNEVNKLLGLEVNDVGQTDGWRWTPERTEEYKRYVAEGREEEYKPISFGITEAYLPDGTPTGNDPAGESTFVLCYNCDGPVLGWM